MATLDGDLKGKATLNWPLVQLARACAAAGKPDLAAKFLAAAPDASAKGWGEWEQFRAKLAGGETPEPSTVGAAGSAAQALAHRALARRLAEKQGEAAALKIVEGWDEKVRPAGIAGVALAGAAVK